MVKVRSSLCLVLGLVFSTSGWCTSSARACSWSTALRATARSTFAAMQSGVLAPQQTLQPAIRLIPSNGQIVVVDEDAQYDDSAEIAEAGAEGETAADSTEADAEQQATDQWKAERLKKIRAIDFDRRPSTILALWSAPRDQAEEADNESEQSETAEDVKTTADEQAAEPEEAAEAETPGPSEEEREAFDRLLKELSRSVTLGQWEAFQSMLTDRQQLSEEEAIAAYERLLSEMREQAPLDFESVVGLSDEMRRSLQAMMGNRRNNPGVRFAEKHALNFDDLVWMLRCAPVPIRDADISKIAMLLRTTLDQGNQLEDFVAALKQAGEEIMPPVQAALLLSQAGRNPSIASFLPPREQAIQEGNAQVLNLWARHYLAVYQEEKIDAQQAAAWELTLAALGSEEAPEKERDEALARAVDLAPQMPGEIGSEWLQRSFRETPERGQEILAAIGTATSQRLAQTPHDAQGRTRNLQLQKAAVDALLESGQELTNQWVAILNLLAGNWLSESQVSIDYSSRSRLGPSMRRDQYGNIYYVDPTQQAADGGQPIRMGQISPVEIDQVLATAPEGDWFQQIDSSLRPQFTTALCRLWLKVNEEDEAFPLIETLAETHAETAHELAEEFLRVWTRNHNPNDAGQRTNYYVYMYGYEQKAESIPLTRSRQERNLDELSHWVTRLRMLPLEDELDEQLLVNAFMTCHSVAEVFEVDRIEQVFGAWGEIQPATMSGLIQRMRSNLADVWRDPNVQRDAATKRRKQDIHQEVQRGYAVANQVVGQALQRYPDHWRLLLTKACVMHDENDFRQEVAPSSEFSAQRLAAFEVFRRAAEAYVEIAPDLPEAEESTDAFDYWFYAALGATDLRGLSEKNRPVDSQIDAIAETLAKLPGQTGQRHRDRFANALFTRMSAVNPACKFRYLEAGFTLVGDNPQAAEARKVYDYYGDLITELELVARIDGSDTVGHTEPFGVFVDLRHTKELERESGGFGKYLQNQNSMSYAYNYGRPTENYRDKFEDAAVAALQEHFDVLSVTFNHPETTSRAVKPSGWRVTPYAYLLLKARGPEVDKLPALKIDMDFLDTSGYVVLPITSSPVPLDASGAASPAAAGDDGPENLEIVQILDERRSTEGQLIVEARATATGLIPDLGSLLDVQQSDFELSEVEDSGVSVIEFDRESTLPRVRSERTWTLTYAPLESTVDAPETFRFPTPLNTPEEIRYQRYVDADLEDVDSEIALVAQYAAPNRTWWIAGLCGVAAVVLAFALLRALLGGSSQPVAETTRSTTPQTPFTVLTSLKAAYEDQRVPESSRTQLRADIEQVERHYFAAAAGDAPPDLNQITERWKSLV